MNFNHLFQSEKRDLEVMEAADLGHEGMGKTSIPIGTFSEDLMMIKLLLSALLVFRN